MIIDWRVFHVDETVSTNLDAVKGENGDVFSAGFQTAGRGRLDHKWFSPPGVNVLMSVVVGVGAIPPEEVATLPIVAGLAVADCVEYLASALPGEMKVKWPNDVLFSSRKVAGILCERRGDNVIVGIGVNVKEQEFPPDIRSASCYIGGRVEVDTVRDALLEVLKRYFNEWLESGFAVFLPRVAQRDFLKGSFVSVSQTDGDSSPVEGVCGGINDDGSLDVAGVKVYAGQAHIKIQRS